LRLLAPSLEHPLNAGDGGGTARASDATSSPSADAGLRAIRQTVEALLHTGRRDHVLAALDLLGTVRLADASPPSQRRWVRARAANQESSVCLCSPY
jgi:hypothetical protein